MKRLDDRDPNSSAPSARAVVLAQELTRPRLVGSDGELAARAAIKQILERVGYRVEQEPFRFVVPLSTVISGQLILGSVLILTSLVMHMASPLAATLVAPLPLLTILLSRPLYKWVWRHWVLDSDPPESKETRFSRWVTAKVGGMSSNLVATYPGIQSDRSHTHLILAAHYDSKSQALAVPLRIILFAWIFILTSSFVLLTVVGLFQPGIAEYGQLSGALAIAAALPLLMLREQNDSPGALDNAAGVGLVLALAEHFAARSDIHSKLRVTYLFPGAEELGLLGSAAYVARNRLYLNHDQNGGRLYVLNLDAVGGKGRLHRFGGSGRLGSKQELSALIDQACRRLDANLGHGAAVGLLLDHIPFAQARIDAVSLVSIGWSARTIHTAHDTPDNFSAETFTRTAKVVVQVVEELAGVGRG
ncbi:MAG: M28 family peptidase [Chloroflexi bacterium]|nr:M28 family peptidase [Chloroflexota bacterium]